jgi:hypothetical protein
MGLMMGVASGFINGIEKFIHTQFVLIVFLSFVALYVCSTKVLTITVM